MDILSAPVVNEAYTPNIVVLSGGSGGFAVLSGMRKVGEHPGLHGETPEPADITALVSVADDGGSSGILRYEQGVLPPGDILKCLMALSKHPEDVRDAFNYRPEAGPAVGHPVGNLLLANLQEQKGSMTEATGVMGRILDIFGRVLPISESDSRLVLEMSNGTTIDGESTLDEGVIFEHLRPKVRLEPPAIITPEAQEAIHQADLVVVAPGSLYGSLGAVLSVSGVAEAMAGSRAKKAFVCNLVHEKGQTDDFTVADYAAEIERFLGHSAPLDYVLYNTHVPGDEDLRARYLAEGRTLVPYDTKVLGAAGYQAIGGNFSSERSLIRHSSRVARALIRLAHSSALSV